MAIIRLIRQQPLAVASLVALLCIIVVTLFAPWLAPYDPMQAFPGLRLAVPGTPGHLLGGDNQGRDMLSRLIWGGRSALGASILPVIFAAAIGLFLGMLAGYRNGMVSVFIMRCIDMLFAFPMVLLAIGLAAVLGSGYVTVIITLICSVIPYLTRVVYSDTRVEVQKEYVEALRAQGASHADILFRELLPNVAIPLLVYTTSLLGGTVVFLAGLSFLGLGVQPPQADWGRMVGEGAQMMILGVPHIATLPALAIVVVSLAFNWLGDGLRDLLDPYR